MDNVLVLGGAGYIGSHMVWQLVEENYYVVVLDNLSTGFKKAVHKKAKFYLGDVENEELLDFIFKKEKIDTVIHFAAFSLVFQSMQNPLKYFKNNVFGTMVLLKSMVKNKVKRIVFSSTAAVYGQVKEQPIKETAEKNPTNCYGETKLCVEKMLKWVGLKEDLKYVCLRYFNAAGAEENGLIGESHKVETHLIPLILKVALKQKEYISVFGTDYDTKDGSAQRDYIWVLDLVRAHILAMKYLKAGGKSDIFNLGSGVKTSVLEVIEAAKEVTNCPIPIKKEEKRQGDPSVLVADFEKAKKILKWEPKLKDIKKIIKTAYKWHKNNPNGFLE